MAIDDQNFKFINFYIYLFFFLQITSNKYIYFFIIDSIQKLKSHKYINNFTKSLFLNISYLIVKDKIDTT